MNVRRAGVEGRGLALRNLLHEAVHLAGACLVDAARLLQARQADAFQQVQRAQRVNLGGVPEPQEGLASAPGGSHALRQRGRTHLGMTNETATWLCAARLYTSSGLVSRMSIASADASLMSPAKTRREAPRHVSHARLSVRTRRRGGELAGGGEYDASAECIAGG